MPRRSDDPRLEEVSEEPEPERRGPPEQMGTVPHDELIQHLEGSAPEPELVEELDAVLEEVPEERGLPGEPGLESIPEGMIPIFNAAPQPFELPYNGDRWTVRAHGIDLVHEEAASLAVGVDNCGGKYSRFGLRRLYGYEQRFKGDARKAGVTLRVFVDGINAQARADAERAYASYNGEVPSIKGFGGMIPPPPEE